MSGYQVQTKKNFKIKQTECCQETIEPQTIYCSFQRINNEVKVNPINLDSSIGYFEFSPISTNMEFNFICTPPYKRVIGVVSIGYPYGVSNPTENVFHVSLPDLPNGDWFGTLSLMVSLY